jgi:hypothetical protein
MAKKDTVHFIVPEGVARVFIGNVEIPIHNGHIKATADQVDDFKAAGYVPSKHAEPDKE